MEIPANIDGGPPVCRLDGEQLASVVLRIPLASAGLGHVWPRDTIRDYGSAVTGPEALFARDLMTLNTADICRRWYGGLNEARFAAARLRALMLFPEE